MLICKGWEFHFFKHARYKAVNEINNNKKNVNEESLKRSTSINVLLKKKMGETTDHADVWKLHAMVYPFILDPKL